MQEIKAPSTLKSYVDESLIAGNKYRITFFVKATTENKPAPRCVYFALSYIYIMKTITENIIISFGNFRTTQSAPTLR